MPTSRFFNLPEEKRRRITEAAVDEFAAKGPDGANVAGVVARAGIPRGSFYQYFSDMDDLLNHVFDTIAAAKKAYMAAVFALAGRAPLLDFLRHAYAKGLQFAADHPRFAAIGRQAYAAQGTLAKALVERARQEGTRFYAHLIEEDKRQGRIRPEVDTELLARLVLYVATDVVQEHYWAKASSDAAVIAIVENLIDILDKGIRQQPGGEQDVRGQ